MKPTGRGENLIHKLTRQPSSNPATPQPSACALAPGRLPLMQRAQHGIDAFARGGLASLPTQDAVRDILRTSPRMYDKAWRTAFPDITRGYANRVGHRLWTHAEYGVLSRGDPVLRFVQDRVDHLSVLNEPPRRFQVDVLARRGMGINAWVYSDGNIMVTPELLESIEYVEELDAVLRHEMRHPLNNHFTLSSGRTLREVVGRSRYDEYEADVDAFVDLSDPRVDSNPLGMLIFLERFAENATPDVDWWDEAHGHPADRAINLHVIAGEWDLGLDGGGLRRIQDVCPELAATDFPESERFGALVTNDRSRLEGTSWNREFQRFCASGSLLSAQALLAATLEIGDHSRTSLQDRLLGGAYDRWQTHLDAFLGGRPKEVRVLTEAVLLETVGIPALSSGSTCTLPGLRQKLRDVRGLWTPETDLLGALADTVNLMQQAFQLDAGALHAVLERVIPDLLMETGCYAFTGDETGFDAARCVAGAEQLVEALDAYQLHDDPNVSAQTRASFERLARLVFEESDERTRHGLVRMVSDSFSYSGVHGAAPLWMLTQLTLWFRSVIWTDEGVVDAACSDIALFSGNLATFFELPEEVLFETPSYFGGLDVGGAVRRGHVFEHVSLDCLERVMRAVGTSQADPLEEVKETARVMLRRLRWAPLAQEDVRLKDSSVESIRKRALRLLDRADAVRERDPTSYWSLALATSYFSAAPGEARKVRTKALQEVIDSLSFRDALRFCETQCYPKGSLLTSDVIARLEKKARSTEDHAAIRWALMRGLRALGGERASSLGAAVGVEYMSRIIDPRRQALLLDALMETHRDESRAVTLLAPGWLGYFQQPLQQVVGQIVEASGGEDLLTVLSRLSATKVYGDLVGWSEWASDDTPYDSREVLTYYRARSVTDILDLLYSLDSTGRLVLLRSLLGGQNGALMRSRNKFLERLLDRYYEAGDATDATVTQVLGSVFSNTPHADLQILCMGLLQDRIATPPASSAHWTPRAGAELGATSAVAYELADDIMQRMTIAGLVPWMLDRGLLSASEREALAEESFGYVEGDTIRVPRPEEDDQGEYFYEHDPPLDSESEMIIDDVVGERLAETGRRWDYLEFGDPADLVCLTHFPGAREHLVREVQERLFAVAGVRKSVLRTKAATESRFLQSIADNDGPKSAEGMNALQVILEAASALGTPGLRFLQLARHLLDLPERFEKGFEKAFDKNDGQMTCAALERVKREAAAVFEHIGDGDVGKVSGGSMYTVLRAKLDESLMLTDGELCDDVAIRVLNPNARYKSARSIKIIRDAFEDLVKSDPQYRVALPLIDLLERWVDAEFQDATFEADDDAFRVLIAEINEKGACPREIVVPGIFKTGSLAVRVERWVDGENFTQFDDWDPNEQKAMLKTVQGCIKGQLMGGASKTGAAMRMGKGEKAEWVVHSDGSIGNWRRTADGRLAILDRNNYLHVTGVDLSHVAKAQRAKSFKARASVLVDWLSKQPENKDHKIARPDERKRVVRRALAHVRMGLSPESQTRRLMHALLDEGVDLTLKVALILKTMNVERALAAKVAV